jgi:hypothetical protein
MEVGLAPREKLQKGDREVNNGRGERQRLERLKEIGRSVGDMRPKDPIADTTALASVTDERTRHRTSVSTLSG